MDKKSIAILLVASSFASSAFATSIVNKLISKHSSAAPSITKTPNISKQTNSSYIDFTGTWLGHCGGDEGGSWPMVIENGDDYIILDGDWFKIGKGLQGTYQSNEDVTEYDHTSFEWNKDGSALIWKNTDISKDNKNNSDIRTTMSTISLTIRNGQINMDGLATTFGDLTQIQQPTTIHCIFNKKQ